MSEAIDWIMDSLFICDLFVNFISAYELEDGTMQVKLLMIANNYIRSWFFIDFFAW